MEFRLNKEKNPIIVLKANNLELDERWILRNPGYFMSNEVGNFVKAFVKTKPKDKKLQRTRLAMAEDYFMDRMVLVKTVCYDNQDLSQPESIRMRRKTLEAQIEILNALRSNMLPEPLDYFEITNNLDHFDDSIKEEFRKTEPVLILDYIPGEVLADKLANEFDKTFYRSDDAKSFSKVIGQVNIEMVMRLAGDILTFEMEMYEKGYAFTTLSPDHIILLRDNKPRFIGIGRICPVLSDRYDSNHVNAGRYLKGFGAPEFNQRETNFGLNASVKANISYNLGALIISILFARTDYDERMLSNGSYDYQTADEDRQIIKGSWKKKGEQVDTLLYELMDPDPSRRLTDFHEILHNLAMISGDAQDEGKKETIYYGNVKFFAHDKGFGYVTCNGQDYRVDLNRLDYIPPGYGDQAGQAVAFTVNEGARGQLFVREFVKPKPALRWPKMVSTAKTIPQPQPVPQPVPQPQPQPQPVPQPRPQPVPQPVPQPQPQPQPVPQPQPQPVPQPIPQLQPRTMPQLQPIPRPNNPTQSMSTMPSGVGFVIKLLVIVGCIALFFFFLPTLGSCMPSCLSCILSGSTNKPQVEDLEENIPETDGQPQNVLNNATDNLSRVRISVDTANVRSGPGTDSPAICLASSGEEYYATGNVVPVGERLWYEIIVDDNTVGWVSEIVINLIE